MNLSMETLARGLEELERLRRVRTESLGRVVGCIRADIASLWDELGIESDEHRQIEFAEFFNAADSLQDTTVSSLFIYINNNII